MEQSDSGKAGGGYRLFRCQAFAVAGQTDQLLSGGTDQGLSGAGGAIDGATIETQRTGADVAGRTPGADRGRRVAG